MKNKTYILLFALLVTVVILVVLYFNRAALGIGQTEQTLLKKGMRGPKVKELQILLNQLLQQDPMQGDPLPLAVNGTFDQRTEDLLYFFTGERSIQLVLLKRLLNR
ncbi:MAG: hypothetical protein ACRBFS_08080 [Aureispira sp.]